MALPSSLRRAAPSSARPAWTTGVLGGALVALIGAGAIWAASGSEVGTLGDTGPGFFPIALGIVLIGLGGVLTGTAFRNASDEPEMIEIPDWRGWLFIVAGVAAFLALGRLAGLAPAAFGCVFLASLSDRSMTVGRALLFAACMTAFAVLIFSVGLKVQMPVMRFGSL